MPDRSSQMSASSIIRSGASGFMIRCVDSEISWYLWTSISVTSYARRIAGSELQESKTDTRWSSAQALGARRVLLGDHWSWRGSVPVSSQQHMHRERRIVLHSFNSFNYSATPNLAGEPHADAFHHGTRTQVVTYRA
jgi:hypothetical protein